jgi:hypothetical protein
MNSALVTVTDKMRTFTTAKISILSPFSPLSNPSRVLKFLVIGNALTRFVLQAEQTPRSASTSVNPFITRGNPLGMELLRMAEIMLGDDRKLETTVREVSVASSPLCRAGPCQGWADSVIF